MPESLIFRDPSVLLIEDSKTDATLINELLDDGTNQFHIDTVSCSQKGLELLKHNKYDIVLLDLNLPDSSGIDSFYQIKTHDMNIPILILTGTNNEETAIEAVKNGAQDYLVKWEFNASLLRRAILYAVERSQLLKDRDELIQNLKQAIKEIRELKELLSICAHCKKIRDDNGIWQQVDVYLQTHTDTDISHSLCPDCVKELYPDMKPKQSKK